MFVFLLWGPYKLAPSCDSCPDDDGEGDDRIWKEDQLHSGVQKNM